MASVFLIGDSHFGHKNICHFTNYDGSRVRPWDLVEEMDEAMVERWNNVVHPCDKVYHLGDFAMTKAALLSISPRLNGTKVLIRGNHDIFKLKDYAQFFKDVRGSHKLGDFILSHIPVHPDSITNRWCKGNVHGHMHNNVVMVEREMETGIGIFPEMVPDLRYINVSVERINFTPVPFENVECYRGGGS